jgi:uncharacterized protein YbaR (Trm112 family)
MIDKVLLDILCCPETKQNLELLNEQTVQKINKAIKEGKVTNRGGEAVKETIDSGLLREDRKYFYPIREDIPIMLIDEAIAFEQFDS